MVITYYCYLVSFAAYLALTLLLAAGWRGHSVGRWLIAACGTMALWSGGVALQERYGLLSAALLWTLETLHSLIWLTFFWKLLSHNHDAVDHSGSVSIYRWGLAISALLLPYIWCMPFLQMHYPQIFRLTYQLIGHVGLVVVGLVLVEQIYRNTRTDERWRIKLLCFALGTLFVYEFYLYSEAILFMRVKEDLWAARGVVAAILTPFIALSASRNPDWSLDIFISRQVVFHSTALLGAGCYLLLMSTAGYYIKYYGGEWGAVLQISFLVGAFMVLALVLFSGQIRAKVRGFVSRHFFSHAFDYRQEWQRLIATLSDNSAPSSLEQRVILALAQVMESPAGMLWVREASGKFTWRASLGTPGMDIPELDSGDPVVDYLERKDTVVNFKEMLTIPEAYEGLNTPAWIAGHRQAWLLVPLWRTSGGIDGLVLLTDSPTFTMWNLEVMEMLKTTSRLVASYLELEAAARALAEARQFEGFNRLSAFVIHDLKNLIAQLSLVVRNAAKHHDNPEFMRDAIATVDHAVGKMNALMSQLRNAGSAAAAETFDLRDALRDALEARKRQTPTPTCDKVSVPVRVEANRQRLASALEHIIHNAQDAAGKQGWVRVRTRVEDGRWAVVEIEDNGCGMDQEFIAARLFKPFETTKGLTGMGIGAYESRELARALGGDISVTSEPGKGSLFVFKIRLAEGATPAPLADCGESPSE
ncbi:MAG: XrtA/PEP-CTERM system histidine kinase PrsK [Candidatus Methylumidiphilus sp.]